MQESRVSPSEVHTAESSIQRCEVFRLPTRHCTCTVKSYLSFNVECLSVECAIMCYQAQLSPPPLPPSLPTTWASATALHNTCIYSQKFSPVEDVCLFHSLLSWVKFLSCNFFFSLLLIKEYIEPMVTFTALVKIYSA